MRIFVAIDLPSKVKDELFVLQNKLKTPNAKIKWVEKKNLHITLKFFGELDEKQLVELKQTLKMIKFASFELGLNNVGVFPSEDFVRVVWAGLEPQDKLIKLQQVIDSDTLEIYSKPQDFKSHLTLGRVKIIKNKLEFSKKLKELSVPKLQFKIDKFYLYESELTKDGPKYKRLEEYSLEG